MEDTRTLYDDWVKPYSRHICITAVALVAIVAVVIGVSSARAAKVARGFAALQAAEDAQAFIDVADEFSGTAPGVQASLEAARRLYEEGKYDQAATRFALVLQTYADLPVAEAARFGEAYSLEAQKEYQGAQKRFADLVESVADTAKIVDACLGVARCARAQGKFAEAGKWIQRASERQAEGVLAYRIEEARKALEAAQVTRPEPAPAAGDNVSTPETATPAAGSAEKANQ